LALTAFGTYGVLHIYKPAVLTHALVTSGVLGAFFLYTLIEAIFIRKDETVIFELRIKT